MTKGVESVRLVAHFVHLRLRLPRLDKPRLAMTMREKPVRCWNKFSMTQEKEWDSSLRSEWQGKRGSQWQNRGFEPPLNNYPSIRWFPHPSSSILYSSSFCWQLEAYIFSRIAGSYFVSFTNLFLNLNLSFSYHHIIVSPFLRVQQDRSLSLWGMGCFFSW